MASFDVVVPCYNYGRFLNRCVSSALEQDGVNVRVLIIDDCSADDSALVGQALADADARVEFRRHATNQGHIATYNEGLIDWAEADYSLLLSADDVLAPGALQRAAKVFDLSGDVGFVSGMATIITHDEEDFIFPADNDFTSFQILPGSEFLRYCCEYQINPIPTAAAIVRTECQHRLGGYRSDLPHTGDQEMWMRFASQGRVGLIRSVQAAYRRHGENMSLNYYRRVLGDRREFALTCRDALQTIDTPHEEAQNWLECMHRGLQWHAECQAIAAFDQGDVPKYEAWSAFAREVRHNQDRPRISRRLLIRELLGAPIWRALSYVRNRHSSAHSSTHLEWHPAHGEVIGWWPDLARSTNITTSQKNMTQTRLVSKIGGV